MVEQLAADAGSLALGCALGNIEAAGAFTAHWHGAATPILKPALPTWGVQEEHTGLPCSRYVAHRASGDCESLRSDTHPAWRQWCLSLWPHCQALYPGSTTVQAQQFPDAVMQMGGMGHPGGEGDMHAGMMGYDGGYAAARRPPHEKRKATNQAGLPDDGYRCDSAAGA